MHTWTVPPALLVSELTGVWKQGTKRARILFSSKPQYSFTLCLESHFKGSQEAWSLRRHWLLQKSKSSLQCVLFSFPAFSTQIFLRCIENWADIFLGIFVLLCAWLTMKRNTVIKKQTEWLYNHQQKCIHMLRHCSQFSKWNVQFH